MSSKNLFLAAGIISLFVFIIYLLDPGPKTLFGFEVNIWIVRLVWLFISVANFANYYKYIKAETNA